MFGAIAGLIDTAVDKIFPDAGERERLKAELRSQLVDNEAKLREAAASVIRAEAGSEHVLAATWRPVLMLIFGSIVANNYILAPYMALVFGVSVQLEIPPDMWDLLKIGVGGYVVGRSAEKTARAWKEAK